MKTRHIPQIPKRIESHFWSKIRIKGPNECWLWKCGCFDDGYGAFSCQRKNHRAHRIAYQIVKGIISQGLCILHSCDNPLCCNPKHLWAGTEADNAADCIAKNRTATGKHHGRFTHPERTARGDRNGLRLHPERVPRGVRSGM